MSSSRNTREFEIVFIIRILNSSKFQIPVKFQSTQAKQNKKNPPKFDKILGCYRLPPLKEISSPRLERLERKKVLGYLGGYHL
jgi:hypothetical protein